MKFQTTRSILQGLHMFSMVFYFLTFLGVSIHLLSNIFCQISEKWEKSDISAFTQFSADLKSYTRPLHKQDRPESMILLIALKQVLTIAQEFPGAFCVLKMFKSISASYKGPHDPWISISQSSYDLLTDQFNIIRNLTRISTTVYFNTLSNYNNKYKRYHLKELLYITKHGYGDIQNLGTLLEVDKVDMEVCANFIYATHNKTTFEFVELFSHYFEIKTQIKTGPKVTKEEKEGMYFCFDTFENYIEDTNRYRPHTIGKVKEGIVVLFEEKGDRHICVKDKEYKVRLINKEGVNSSLQWELNDHQKRGSYVIFETTHSFIEEDGFLVFCVRNRTGVYMNENYKRSTVKDEHKTERENDKLLVKLIDFNTGTTLLDFYVESI